MMHKQENMDIALRQTNRSVEENRVKIDIEEAQLIFDKRRKQFGRKIIAFSINRAGIIEYSYYSIIQKININSYLMSYIKRSSKRIIDLSVSPRTVRYLKEKHRKNICDFI